MLELYPDYSISVTLFSEVSNITELREMLIQGKLTAAFVNATMVNTSCTDIYNAILFGDQRYCLRIWKIFE